MLAAIRLITVERMARWRTALILRPMLSRIALNHAAVRWLPIVAFALLLSTSKMPSQLELIYKSGVLTVVSRNSSTTWQQDAHGDSGFEYDLANAFAQQLGVRLVMQSADNLPQLLGSLAEPNGPALAAAGLIISDMRQTRLRFSAPYLRVSTEVVYKRGTPPPKRPEDLVGKRIGVIQNSHQAELLGRLKERLPDLSFEQFAEQEVADLLQMVDKGRLDLTLISSNGLAIHQIYFPKVRVAFELAGGDGQIAWAINSADDGSLLKAVNQFLAEAEENGTLQKLKNRYYGHIDVLGYAGALSFARHLEKRLPLYEDYFRAASEETGLDWRLLAAVSYQESLWQPEATSKTGVRGLMMLTNDTAADMGVEDRLNPAQSIQGGSRYLAQIKNRLPQTIKEPNRTWFALAAYNIGLGHLHDARALAQAEGLNPDRWSDVMPMLPLLMQKQWHEKTRYGYARGGETVHYVHSVRRYYDILRWMKETPTTETTLAASQEN